MTPEEFMARRARVITASEIRDRLLGKTSRYVNIRHWLDTGDVITTPVPPHEQRILDALEDAQP